MNNFAKNFFAYEDTTPMSSRPCMDCNRAVTARRRDGTLYERCFKCDERRSWLLTMKKCPCGNSIQPQYAVCYKCSQTQGTRSGSKNAGAAQSVFDELGD